MDIHDILATGFISAKISAQTEPQRPISAQFQRFLLFFDCRLCKQQRSLVAPQTKVLS